MRIDLAVRKDLFHSFSLYDDFEFERVLLFLCIAVASLHFIICVALLIHAHVFEREKPHPPIMYIMTFWAMAVYLALIGHLITRYYFLVDDNYQPYSWSDILFLITEIIHNTMFQYLSMTWHEIIQKSKLKKSRNARLIRIVSIAVIIFIFTASFIIGEQLFMHGQFASNVFPGVIFMMASALALFMVGKLTYGSYGVLRLIKQSKIPIEAKTSLVKRLTSLAKMLVVCFLAELVYFVVSYPYSSLADPRLMYPLLILPIMFSTGACVRYFSPLHRLMKRWFKERKNKVVLATNEKLDLHISLDKLTGSSEGPSSRRNTLPDSL